MSGDARTSDVDAPGAPWWGVVALATAVFVAMWQFTISNPTGAMSAPEPVTLEVVSGGTGVGFAGPASIALPAAQPDSAAVSSASRTGSDQRPVVEQPPVEDVETPSVVPEVDPVWFATGSSVIAPEDRARLDEVAAYLSAERGHAEISGHTDSVGSEEFNLALSRERAEAVAAYLLAGNVDGELITVVAHGESRPAAPNDTAEGRALNRRVEVHITG